MRNILLILLICASFVSCVPSSESKFKSGDHVQIVGSGNTDLTIINVNSCGCGSTNYTARYKDNNGVIQEINITEDEIITKPTQSGLYVDDSPEYEQDGSYVNDNMKHKMVW